MVLLFLHTLAQPVLCQERACMAGVGLTSFLRGSAEISISYSYSRHWSVRGEASISYEGLTRRKTSVEVEHNGEFANTSSLHNDRSTHCESILFGYWPSEAFRGFSLSAGVQSCFGNGTEIITEAGYTFRIWKGICMSMGIRIPILTGIRNGNINAENIRAEINYRF